MRRHASAWIGSALITTVAAMALVAVAWTPHAPWAINLKSRLQPPGMSHWLGTDEFGRDVLSRIMAAAATSLLVATLAVTIALLLGVLLGVLAGYFRGAIDRALMVVNDALLAFPNILFAFGVMAVVGPNKYGVIVALGLAYAPTVVRMVRSSVLSLRERGYVDASRVIGNSEVSTMFRHVLPNCAAPILVLATSMMGWVVLAEGTLNFLGLGVPPPAPTWGNMLASGRPYMESAPWLCIAPGMCFTLTLLGINLLGDAVRDQLDPRTGRG